MIAAYAANTLTVWRGTSDKSAASLQVGLSMRSIALSRDGKVALLARDVPSPDLLVRVPPLCLCVCVYV